MNKIRGGDPRSDILVLFGVTGDLARKKIFPALHAMAKRGTLEVPVVGVASAKHTLAELRERAEAAIRESGEVDARALRTVISSLRYVGGDYEDPATFIALKSAL